MTRLRLSQQLRLYLRTLGLVWQTDRKGAVIVMLLTLLRATFPVANLYALKLLLDAVALTLQGQTDNWSTLVHLTLLQAGLLGLSGVVHQVAQGYTEVLAEALRQHCTRLILHKSTRLEIPQFENPDVHNLMRLALNDVGMRPLSAMVQALTFVQTTLTLLSLSAIMAALGGPIVLLLFVAAIPLTWVSFYFNRASLEVDVTFTESQRMQQYLAGVMVSDQAAKELRVFGFSEFLLNRWQEHYQRYRVSFGRLVRNRSAAHSLTALTSALFGAGATLLILQRVMQQTITIGDFSFLTGGVTQIQAQFSALANVFAKSNENLLYMHQFFTFLDLSGRHPDDGLNWDDPIETIEFDDVSFTYPLTQRPVLHHISFTARVGETLAVVGENGAGKSTLIKLLTRLYEPTHGRILFNGRDIRAYSSASLQRQLSAVFQDFGQYHLSAADNITAGVPGSEDDMRRAAHQAGAAGFIERFSSTYQQTLGRTFTSGVQLSGGQWQRLALARLYHKPARIWIMDEPTSALDANAEPEVIASLKQRHHERLAVIITHRMNTASQADRILVLEQGRLSALGTHTHLLDNSELYAHLYHTQANSFQRESLPLAGD